MTIYPRLFMRLLDGRAGGVASIAYVPTEVGVYFSAMTHDVKIEKLYMLKLINTHKLNYGDLENVQRAINEGYIFRGRQPQYLEFIYVDGRGPVRHYLLVLKAARYGQEIWVQTFHRSDETALRSRVRKQTLLRAHL